MLGVTILVISLLGGADPVMAQVSENPSLGTWTYGGSSIGVPNISSGGVGYHTTFGLAISYTDNGGMNKKSTINSNITSNKLIRIKKDASNYMDFQLTTFSSGDSLAVSYRFSSRTLTGTIAVNDNVTVHTLYTAPGAPANLSAVRGDQQVVLSWTAGSDGGDAITKHQYRQKAGSGSYGSWTDILNSAPGGANATSYTVENLTNGTTYYFQVRAVNGAGGGTESGEASETPGVLPGAPANLSAVRGDQQVVLSWTAGSEGGSAITKHQYRQKAGSGSYGSWTDILNSAPGGANATSYTVENLTNGTTYYFQVRAVNGAGGGTESGEASATPAAVPDAPANLSPIRGDQQVTLSWTAGSDGGSAITGHQVRQKAGSGSYGSWTDIPNSAPGEANATSYTMENLTNGTTYNFQVRAVNDVGGGTESGEASATPGVVPGAPANLSAVRGDQQVVLSWTPGSDGSLAITKHQYRQKAGSGSYGSWTDIPNSAPGGANATSYSVENLTNGTTYNFQVRAVNDAGSGMEPNEVSATPRAAPVAPVAPVAPGAPANLSAARGDRQVILSWTAGSDGGSAIIKHQVRQKADGGSYGSWTDIPDSVPGEANATHHIVTGLDNGTGYSFQVRAVNDVGSGMESNEARATPEAKTTDAKARYRKVSQSILPRVARTVVNDILGAVTKRFATLGLDPTPSPATTSVVSEDPAVQLAALPAASPDPLASGWAMPPESGGVSVSANREERRRDLGFREVMIRSNFVAQAGGKSALGDLAVWGAGRYRNLSESANDLGWSGDLYGARFGVDGQPHPQWLTGLSLDWSEGEFDWSGPDPSGGPRRSGRYDISLTGVYPYAGWVSADRSWHVWGLAGYGSGRVELREDAAERATQKSDIDMVSTALGASWELWRSENRIPGGTTTLRGKVQGSMTQVELDGNGEAGALEELDVGVQSLRFGMEARHERALEDDGWLVPSLEVAVRGDFGDGERLSGLEVGAGLSWFDPGRGLLLEGSGYVLAVSNDSTKEWGVDGFIRYDRGMASRGLMLDLSWGYGATRGMGTLWTQEDLSNPASDGFDSQLRLGAKLSYGVWAGIGLLTPFGGFDFSGEDDRRYRLGLSWTVGDYLNLVGEHLESPAGPDNRLMLTTQMTF